MRLLGCQVTPNTIAALLTIMGFSLYDTIVVFHRIKENTASLSKTSFHQMANDSINQVFMRTINTTLTAMIPPLVDAALRRSKPEGLRVRAHNRHR